jgi:hypothetical protein
LAQVYQCWWRICREINFFFQFRISHVLSFISIYWLSLVLVIFMTVTKKSQGISILNFYIEIS